MISMHLTGPVSHKNLSVYFVHGDHGASPVPLSLDEALQSKKVEVKETGDIGMLTIRNKGKEEVFIQLGDIVKGGLQDRIIKVSTILKPHSKEVPVETLCVESGRWGQRQGEEPAKFTRSRTSAHKRMKLVVASSMDHGTERMRNLARLKKKSHAQGAVWDEVDQRQQAMSSRLGSNVRHDQSPTSYELYRNHEAVVEHQNHYKDGLRAEQVEQSDTVGVFFAMNGKIHNGELYESHALFRKMWDKNLDATVNEAISETRDTEQPSPALASIQTLIAELKQGEVSEAQLSTDSWIKNCTTENAMLIEAQRENRSWVHRHYATGQTVET